MGGQCAPALTDRNGYPQGVCSHWETASGATAVQFVWSFRRGSRNIEHIGSAHDDAELEVLKAAARQRLAAGQLELVTAAPGPSGPLEIASSRMDHLRMPHRVLPVPVDPGHESGDRS